MLLIFLPTRSDLADFLYHANNHNIAMGGGDRLVSEALYFAIQKAMVLKSIMILQKTGYGETVLSKWIHWKLMSMI